MLISRRIINQQQASSYRAERKNNNITQHNDKYKSNTMNNAAKKMTAYEYICLGAQHMTTTFTMDGWMDGWMDFLCIFLLYQKSLLSPG